MKRVLVVALLVLGGSAASAQQTFSEVQRAVMAQQNAQVRVTVGINMFVPAPGGLTEQSSPNRSGCGGRSTSLR